MAHVKQYLSTFLGRVILLHNQLPKVESLHLGHRCILLKRSPHMLITHFDFVKLETLTPYQVGRGESDILSQ